MPLAPPAQFIPICRACLRLQWPSADPKFAASPIIGIGEADNAWILISYLDGVTPCRDFSRGMPPWLSTSTMCVLITIASVPSIRPGARSLDALPIRLLHQSPPRNPSGDTLLPTLHARRALISPIVSTPDPYRLCAALPMSRIKPRSAGMQAAITVTAASVTSQMARSASSSRGTSAGHLPHASKGDNRLVIRQGILD